MARIQLDWDCVKFPAKVVTGWVSFRRTVQLEEHEVLLSDRAVYVIRVERPYSFGYKLGRHSPVAYIGKGNAQQRLTSHLTSWIPLLSDKIPDLKMKIYFCEPRVRRLGAVCEHVEADLIKKFLDLYKERPIVNRVTPKSRGQHEYEQKQLHVLYPGQGIGYHWAITPLRSSPFFRSLE